MPRSKLEMVGEALPLAGQRKTIEPLASQLPGYFHFLGLKYG